jgi:hypothetical protein
MNLFRLAVARSGINECQIVWLLKNSLSKNPRKLDRVRMPYKRFAGVA